MLALRQSSAIAKKSAKSPRFEHHQLRPRADLAHRPLQPTRRLHAPPSSCYSHPFPHTPCLARFCRCTSSTYGLLGTSSARRGPLHRISLATRGEKESPLCDLGAAGEGRHDAMAQPRPHGRLQRRDPIGATDRSARRHCVVGSTPATALIPFPILPSRRITKCTPSPSTSRTQREKSRAPR